MLYCYFLQQIFTVFGGRDQWMLVSIIIIKLIINLISWYYYSCSS